jgi:type IV secretion system protein VirD4
MANNDHWKYLGWTIKGIGGAAKAGAWAYSTAQSAEQARRLERAIADASKPPDPMEGFAKGAELDQYRYSNGALYLGRMHGDHGVNFDAGITDDRGVFIVAGSRSGKGTSFYIPNCILWEGPLVCVDPKGEAASITALRRGTREAALGTGTNVREFIGQDVAVLDPLGEVRGPARAYCTSYNPMGDIDMTRGGGVGQIRAIANGMVTQSESGEKEDEHFLESAETIIAGIIEMMMMAEENPRRRNLPNVRQIVLGGRDAILYHLTQIEEPGELAKEAVSIIEDVGKDEWSAYRSTLSRALKWMIEPGIREQLRQSDFSLWDNVQKGGSVFFVVKSTRIDEFKSWLRIMINMALEAKTALGPNQTGPKTLFMLDEFASLGKMRLLEKAVAEMPGYGIKLVPVIQGIGQMSVYGKNWETFLDNTAALIGWGFGPGKESPQLFSDLLGRYLRREISVGDSAGMGGTMNLTHGQSINEGLQERFVRYPNQVREESTPASMRSFVISAHGKPFTIRRRPYFEEFAGQGLFDDPDHIRAWEENFRGFSS